MTEHPSLTPLLDMPKPSQALTMLNECLWLTTKTYHAALQETRKAIDSDKSQVGLVFTETLDRVETLFNQILSEFEKLQLKMADLNPNAELEREVLTKLGKELGT